MINMVKYALLVGIIALGVLYYIFNPFSGEKQAQSVPSSETEVIGLQGISFTQGSATVINPGILDCKGGRVSALGEIASDDGEKWIVPSNVNLSLSDASDLSNRCTGVEFASVADVDLDSIPIVEIDPDGVVITGYIYADNYFELYVNGKAVAKDPVPFTPFNASIVRFKAKYPMTYAVKAVDWEENLGLGTEDNRGNKYHYGDAGFVGVFSDGTVTDESWKAQTYYIAPLMSRDEVTIVNENGQETRTSPDYSEPPSCNSDCYAAHFGVPVDWYGVNFDDSAWPIARVYSASAAGVDNKREYTNYAEEFGKGELIWTSNLNLDNEVLLRRTVHGK